MELIESQRGHPKLAYKGYLFTKNCLLASGGISWVCEQRSRCKSRMTTLDERVISEPSLHTHAPDSARIETEKVRRAIKRRATSTQESTQQILSETMQHISQSAGAQLPVQ
jgi:hypothetical protein